VPRLDQEGGVAPAKMNDWHDDESCLAEHHWPFAPSHLLPRERWLWWE